ncbi:GNAT family N-acetyltransferase [Kribbella sp. NPDC056861]|uniref:GNAT family N-acetyltransferase n=1 Tax=Kribbella sp. NPDC056861 TaxID=3154857 RepID=UPI003413B386
MPSSITLQPITAEHHPLTERLWQLYRHDLSEYRGTYPDAAGLYPTERLRSFFTEPDRCGYLVRQGDQVAGFVLVRGLAIGLRVMGEFFVLRAARRQQVGWEAALQVLRLHPGDWEIAFQENNPGAARFWRRVAAETARDGYKDELRPVPGKPEVEPDTWLSFTV